MFKFLPFLLLSGCFMTWDWPAAPPKHKPNNCVQVINGKYLYFDDCKVPPSNAQPVLPP